MNADGVVALADRGLGGFHRLAHDHGQVHRLPLQGHQPAGDAAHVHQVVDERDHVVDLALHHFAQALDRLLVVGRALHHFECVAQRCERVAQLVREDGDELVLAAVGVLQRELGLLAHRDVVEEHRDQVLLGPADAERVHVVPAVQCLGPVLETNRAAGDRHLAVGAKPVRFVGRCQFEHAFAHRIGQAGLTLETGVDLDEAVVDGRHVGIEDQLDDAEPFVDRVEEGLVLVLRGPRFEGSGRGGLGVRHRSGSGMGEGLRGSARLRRFDRQCSGAIGIPFVGPCP